MKARLWSLCVLLLVAVSVQAQDIIGTWSGKLDVGPMRLTIVFHFSKGDDGKLKCTLDSPDQGVKDIPATAELLDGSHVKVNIPALGVNYEATFTSREISGTFSQSGMSFPLVLKPGELAPNRPQTPGTPYPYATEEVTFKNAADGAHLTGTLTYPVNYRQLKNVPVVIMVTGSGQQNRDEELFGHKPFLVLADCLAKHGIASLRYDDRGVGGSTGDVEQATTQDFMRDAVAAVDFVKGTGKFGKCGVLGHSEGGTVAFMLAARGKVDFVISMAGTALRGDTVLIQQNRAMLTAGGVSEQVCDDYCRVLRELFAMKEKEGTVADPEARVEEVLRQTGVSLPSELAENLVDVLRTDIPWLTYFLAYDPAGDIRKTTCPVLAINGSRDLQVLAKENLASIRNNLPVAEHGKSVIKEYEGLNHLFQHCTTGLPLEYGTIEETIAPEVLSDIVSWIETLIIMKEKTKFP